MKISWNIKKNPDILQNARIVEEIKNLINIAKFSNFEKMGRITTWVKKVYKENV